MTTKEINKTEFEEWGERIWKIAEIVLEKGQESQEDKAEIAKVISIFCVKIMAKNTFALEKFNNILSEKFESLPVEVKEKKYDFPCEDGEKRKMTGQEWAQYLHQRVENHHRTRVGKDITDQDLPLIAQRFETISDWNNDEKKSEQILSEIYSTNKEDYDLIYGIIDLNNKFFDITKQRIVPTKIAPNQEELKACRYILEDLSQILFRAQEAIEKEKDEPEVPEKKQKEKKKEENKHQIKTLEEEIKELERQNKDLKEKLANASLAPEKRTILEENLKENNKQREKTQAKLGGLQRELKNTDGGNDKMNLAIGLGIFAAVVAVICLIILLARPSRRNQY